MSESFKQQGIPGEVPGVIREDSPRPLLGRPDDSIPPAGLSTLGVDGPGFEINVPSTEPVDDLPLDSGSGHKGLHCPLPATESADQVLGLRPGQPYFTRFVRLGGGYVSDWVVGDGFDFHQIVGEHGESRTITHLRGARDWEAFQEDRNVAFREPLSAEALALRDKAPNLSFVLRPSIPLIGNGVQVYLIERGNELGQSAGFVGRVEIRESRSFYNYELQRFPLETPLEGSYHLLNSAGGSVVGSSASLRSAPLVGEVESSFVDRAALASEGHLDAGDAPVDAPVSRARIYTWGVTLYPGRDSNSYSALAPRDFERVSSPKGANDLPDSPSVTPSNRVEASVSDSNPGCPPEMPHGVSQLSRVRREM